MEKPGVKRILVFGRPKDCSSLKEATRGRDFEIIRVSSQDEVRELAPDACAIICDLRGDQGRGWEPIFEVARQENNSIRLIVSTTKITDDLWIKATDFGAHGILKRPFTKKEIGLILEPLESKTLKIFIAV